MAPFFATADEFAAWLDTAQFRLCALERKMTQPAGGNAPMECALRTLLSAFLLATGWVAAASASGEIGDVTVTLPPTPTAQELAGNSLDEFILHHATTHYVNDATARNLARWRGGLQSICPGNCGAYPGLQRLHDSATSLDRRFRGRACAVGPAMQKQRANTFHEQPPGENGRGHEMGDGARLSQQVCGGDEGPDSV